MLSSSLANSAFDFAESGVNWLKVERCTTSNSEFCAQASTSIYNFINPIRWDRGIIFPNKEYFIVFDYMNNSVSREIDTLFHLTSLKVDPVNISVIYSNSTSRVMYGATGNYTMFNIPSTSQSAYLVFRTSPINDTPVGWNVSFYLNGNFIGNVSYVSVYYTMNTYRHLAFNASLITPGWNNVSYNSSDNLNLTLSYMDISVTGNVLGNLSINGDSYDWLSPISNAENIVISDSTGNAILWNTSNVYNQSLQTQIFSIPDSNISVEKLFTRVGGYDTLSEVDHPIVRFKLSSYSSKLYRISVINTRYTDTEPEFTYSDIGLTNGTGNALTITNGTWTDTVHFGNKSLVSFGNFKSDANYSWNRNNSGVNTFFIRGGSTYKIGGIAYFSSASVVDYALVTYSSDNVTVITDGTTTTNTTIYAKCDADTRVYRDGITVTKDVDWGCVDSNNIWVDIVFGSQVTYDINQTAGGGGTVVAFTARLGNGIYKATFAPTSPTACAGAVNQTAEVGLYNITNVGDAEVYIQMRLQTLMTNVDIVCSSAEMPENCAGGTVISTSYQTILGPLAKGEQHNIWCWAIYATPTTTGINSMMFFKAIT